MKIEKMVVTGDSLFLKRYRLLLETLSQNCEQLEYVNGDNSHKLTLQPFVGIFKKVFHLLSPEIAGKLQKTERAFIAKSRRTEKRVGQLGYKPDFVLHCFSMYCPFWDHFEIPYAMYLDYTMSLVQKNWSPWAPFKTVDEFEAWVNCERLAYKRAAHLFTMSQVVKRSLVTDYGITPEKITVVGSFANRHGVYEGEKHFGNQQVLFNGSEFERKGGDLVLDAFQRVKATIPSAKLVIVGKKLPIQQSGVENPGKIASLEEMRQLFLNSDLVVAPGRCNPFSSFVIEAMNYGIPCIVSGNDGMPEIVDHGINGMVLNPLTPELLAEKMIYLLNDTSLLNSMSKKARQKIRVQLNRDKVTADIMQVIQAL